jgi:hypothetical protein
MNNNKFKSDGLMKKVCYVRPLSVLFVVYGLLILPPFALSVFVLSSFSSSVHHMYPSLFLPCTFMLLFPSEPRVLVFFS